VMAGEPLESKRIAGDLLMFDQGRRTPVHRAERCQVRSGNAKLRTQMPPQQRRHHPYRIEEPAAHAQKPDLQRKSQLELGPTPLFDDPGFLGRELENTSISKAVTSRGRCRRPKNVACQLSMAHPLKGAPYTVTKRDQQVIESTARIDIGLYNYVSARSSAPLPAFRV
jgi:hypothetical protein